MKKKEKLPPHIIAVGAFAVFIALGLACATSGGGRGGEVIADAGALKEYLESLPANTPAAPLRVTLKINNSTLNDVADTLRSTDKYVVLRLEDDNRLAGSFNNIPDAAFRDCKSLTYLDLSYSSVAKIGADAFRGCTNLTTLYMPLTLREFTRSAVIDCPSLTGFSFPSSSSIGITTQRPFSTGTKDGALYNGDETVLLVFPPGITGDAFIGNPMFTNDPNQRLGRITIAPNAFDGSNLTSITFGNVDVKANAFINCSKLTSVTINEFVTMDSNAFGNLGNLYQVYASLVTTTVRDGRRITDDEKAVGTYIREIGSNTWRKVK